MIYFIGGPKHGELSNKSLKDLQGLVYAERRNGKEIQYEYIAYDNDSGDCVARYIPPKPDVPKTPLLDRFKWEVDRFNLRRRGMAKCCQVAQITYDELCKEYDIKCDDGQRVHMPTPFRLHGAHVTVNNSVPAGSFKFTETKPTPKFDLMGDPI